MKKSNGVTLACIGIAILLGVCGCGTFPMRGDTKCAIFTAYPGAPLSSGEMATISLSRQDGVWVAQLDGQTVRFGPFPPMGAWQEIVFEVAPGLHTVALETLAGGAPTYDPNTGRYQSSGEGNRGRTTLTFTAVAGGRYTIRKFHVEDMVTGKPVLK